ncbi:MAG: LamG-like jellyroll fold domain-containing protein [Bacteroidota bacterium]
MKSLNSNTRFILAIKSPVISGVFISLFYFLLSFNPVSAQNHCLNFDGNGDYVGFSTMPAYNSTMTIEAWIKISIPTGYTPVEPEIVSWSAYSQTVEFRLGVSGTTATLQFGIDASPTTAWQGIYGSTNINNGKWVHVAVVKNGTTSTLYINGVSETSGTLVGSPTPNIFQLGNLYEHNEQKNKYFPGLIDEVRLWSTARSQAEIQANMNKELVGNESGLNHYYKMTNGSGSTLTDNVSSGGLNGTIYGNTAWNQPDAFPVQAFVSGTYAARYATLKGAFDAINAGTHSGAITLKLAGSTYETASAILYASGYANVSYYTSVTIYPTITGLSITGNLAAPLIDLNGGDHVTINGSVNQGNSSADLIISNLSTSSTDGTSTIRLINDATYNTVQYCTLKGSNRVDTYSPGGIVLFSNTDGTAGNDNNTISYNNITNAGGNRPTAAIFSYGSVSRMNSNNTISYNNFFDFINLSSNLNSHGIFLFDNNTSFNLVGNSFYETDPVIPTGSGWAIFIDVREGSNHAVTGNFIGGRAASCGGSALTKTNANGNNFVGIYVQSAANTTNIQSNTIQNINWSNSDASNFYGMSIQGTSTTIGTNGTPNIIGATTGTGSIILTNATPGGIFYGLDLGGNMINPSLSVSGNIIGAITTANASTNNTDFYGISLIGSGNTTISSNTIGSNETANSINASSTSTANEQDVYGIYSSGSGTNIMSGNTIANLKNSTTNSTSGTLGCINGINASAGTNTISNNTVRDLTIANYNSAPRETAAVNGIVLTSTTVAAQNITGNEIYNLSNTYATFSGNVNGLYYSGPATESRVSGNFIHSLTASNSSTAASIWAMYVYGGTTTFSNNIINLGGNTTSSLRGIQDLSGTNKYYFNTVYIGGAPTSGSQQSFAMLCAGSNTKNIRNNLFVNARSNNGANGSHFAIYLADLNNLTIDYNDYYVSGTGTQLGWYLADKTSLDNWKSATSQDANSVNTNPSFAVSPPGTTAANYVVSASLPGVSISGITTDYFGTTRTATPRMGVYDGPACANPANGGTITAVQTICTGFVPDAITSSAAPTGHTGTLEYKWQKSTTSASVGFSDIDPAATSVTYAPPALSATTWYKRLSKVTCDATWAVAGESNVLQITVNQPSYSARALPTVSSLQASGTGLKWYLNQADVSPLASNTTLIDGHIYYASQTVNGCESPTRFKVVGNVDMTPCAPTGNATQTFSNGATVASLSATGSVIRWYSTASGGNALPTSTVLTNGTHYYATQTLSCTESETRLDVRVTIN